MALAPRETGQSAVSCSDWILFMASLGWAKARPKCGKGSRGADLESQRGAGSGPSQLKETMMRFDNRRHRFYAGIDLHSRSMHLCVLEAQGPVVLDVNLYYPSRNWSLPSRELAARLSRRNFPDPTTPPL